MSDTLYLQCSFCDYEISKHVEDNALLSPSLAERWHLRLAKHIRRHHVKSKETN